MNQLLIETLVVGQLQTNCYLVADQKSRAAVVIDPGDGAEYIHNKIRDLELIPTKIVATHGHFDHILAAFEIQQAYKIPFLINAKDTFLVERMQDTAKFFLKINIHQIPPHVDGDLKEGSKINFGSLTFKVIETPGHTPGSVCLYFEDSKIMFTGDTLFKSGVGRTDFSYGSQNDLEDSLKKIKHYPGGSRILSGHGEETCLEEELGNL